MVTVFCKMRVVCVLCRRNTQTGCWMAPLRALPPAYPPRSNSLQLHACIRKTTYDHRITVASQTASEVAWFGETLSSFA